MKFQSGTASRTSVQVGMKLARLLELPEGDFAGRVRELESDVLFQRLLHAKVISVQPYAGTGFMVQRFGGWGLRTASDGIPAALDGQGDLAKLLQTVGEKRFQEFFLSDEGHTDDERAKMCRISKEEAGRLRELVNSLYVQAEFDGASSTAAPVKTYSAVAGITVDAGKPSLAFFNRQIWKGRYQVNKDKSRRMLDSLPAAEARRLEGFLRELGLLDRRKSTLYRVLEALIENQAAFFVSGDPDKRRPLTQRDLVGRLDISPSVLNRLISNKSVQLPWGLEAPMKTLVPSRKSLIRGRLHDLLRQYPTATDEELGRKIDRLYRVRLSLRSVAQYRTELGLGNLRKRRQAAV